MNHSPELNELAGALCAAQAEFTSIPKDSTNPFFKSSYAGLPRVVEVASPILTKHGLAVSQFIGADETGDTLTTWLLHKSGQFIAQSMRLHLTKDDAQGQGSATTYARRYSYMAVLGLVADDDDDGNAAARRQPARAKAANGNGVATDEDVAALTAAAKGLKAVQLKDAFAMAGLAKPERIDANVFRSVPREKSGMLARALAGMDRA